VGLIVKVEVSGEAVRFIWSFYFRYLGPVSRTF